MTTQQQTQPLVQITDPGFRSGFEEAQEPYYADCGIRTDMGLAEVVRAMLTEYAVEMGLSEQHRLYHWDSESKLVYNARYLGILPGYLSLIRSIPL